MAKITLFYKFDQESDNFFEYDVEFDYSSYLKPYFEDNYIDVKDAVEDLDKRRVFEGNEKEGALQCKSFEELADYITNIGEYLAEFIFDSDKDFVYNYILEDLEDENEDDAREAYYEEVKDGYDPGDINDWDDYWYWRNFF